MSDPTKDELFIAGCEKAIKGLKVMTWIGIAWLVWTMEITYINDGIDQITFGIKKGNNE